MTRRLFTTAEFYAEGGTRDALRWSVKKGRCTPVVHCVYGEGPAKPTPFEISLGSMLASGKPAWGLVAGQLHGFDGIEVNTIHTERTKRRLIDDTISVVDGYRCTSPLQTLADVSCVVDDDVFEQALESAVFKQYVSVADVVDLVARLSRMRHQGVGRIRRVLARRPEGAPPTESMLETLMVQIARLVPGLPPPVRQYVLVEESGRFVARIDLCWPELGIFIELDGQGHEGQPVYDAARQTDIVATTGWLCGRFTWKECRHHPKASAARLVRLVEQARRRPVPAS